MNGWNILSAVLSLSLMGLLFGGLLALASKIFAVKMDERIPKIVEALPGANCGGCGYAGCTAFATAVASGTAPVTGCPVGGQTSADAVAAIMGQTVSKQIRLRAVCHCGGTDAHTEKKYKYEGIADCASVMRLGGGEKTCAYSCTGLGSCAAKCPFDVITMENGVPVFDEERCTACGICVATCPKDLIELVPADKPYIVQCSSKAKGAETRKVCKVGCIACRLCEKACKFDAIHVDENLAHIDYERCTSCGACAEVCPQHTIFCHEKIASPQEA